MVIAMWARIENAAVVELTDIDPEGRFHPSMRWLPCGADVQLGWLEQDGALAAAQVSLQDLASRLQAAATAQRWTVETGGLTLPGGVRIATGIEDQNRITSVVANAERSGVTVVDFKGADGWRSVALQEVQAMAAAIALHVQACFTAERQHHEAINTLAGLDDETQARQQLLTYDVMQGWPQ